MISRAGLRDYYGLFVFLCCTYPGVCINGFVRACVIFFYGDNEKHLTFNIQFLMFFFCFNLVELEKKKFNIYTLTTKNGKSNKDSNQIVQLKVNRKMKAN